MYTVLLAGSGAVCTDGTEMRKQMQAPLPKALLAEANRLRSYADVETIVNAGRRCEAAKDTPPPVTSSPSTFYLNEHHEVSRCERKVDVRGQALLVAANVEHRELADQGRREWIFRTSTRLVDLSLLAVRYQSSRRVSASRCSSATSARALRFSTCTSGMLPTETLGVKTAGAPGSDTKLEEIQIERVNEDPV
jgi:hypothetical protein